jgi:hypothetical protein
MTKVMKNNDAKLLISLLGGIILGVTLVVLTGCVSKHPKCAAYDKVQTIEK